MVQHTVYCMFQTIQLFNQRKCLAARQLSRSFMIHTYRSQNAKEALPLNTLPLAHCDPTKLLQILICWWETVMLSWQGRHPVRGNLFSHSSVGTFPQCFAYSFPMQNGLCPYLTPTLKDFCVKIAAQISQDFGILLSSPRWPPGVHSRGQVSP